MAEYIEREKAIEEIDSWLDSVGSIIVGKGLSSYGELIGCIQDVPAADVTEVKHGKWKKRGNEKTCSCCKFIYYSNNDTWNYCPKCGAIMDGAKDGVVKL